MVDSSLPDQLSALSEKQMARLRSRLGRRVQPTIPVIARDGHFPLSLAQQRLWFLNQLEGQSSTYNTNQALQLLGALNVDVLRQALGEIVRRHESLRTTFQVISDELLQVISPTAAIPLPVLDLQSSSQTEQSAKVQQLSHEAAGEPFDLSHDLLIRTSLLKLSPQSHVLLITMHHIVSDGWSMGIFNRELSKLYADFSQGNPSSLSELSIQYVDFSHWQRQYLQGKVLKEQLNYWQQQLANAPLLLELPTDYVRPPVQSFQGKTEHFELSPTLTKQLKQLAQRSEMTLFMLLLSAFATLLHRYSGQEDIVIGSPIANRRPQELESLIGLLLNTLVLRVKVSAEQPFEEVLAHVKQTALDAYAHQDVPFEQLIEILKPTRDASYSPWFQVMFILQNTPRQALEMPGLRITPLSVETAVAKFDITLSMLEREKRLVGSWEYSTDLFEPATAKRMIEQFYRLLEEIVTSPNATVASFLCSEASEAELSLSILNDQELAKDREMKDANSLIEELADLSEEEVQKLLDDSV